MRLPALMGGVVASLCTAIGAAAGLHPDARAHSGGLRASDLGVIVNTADPLSVAIGDYYIRKRHIPRTNLIELRFDPQRDEIPDDEFAALKAAADEQAHKGLQAYALTWARPYRAGCMSITSAFALGLDPKFCATGCAPTQRSEYFDAAVSRPYDQLRLRPTMTIAALDLQNARALIDRGVAADGSVPPGSAYLGLSNDRQRNVRATEYREAVMVAGPKIRVRGFSGGSLVDRPDVLFYFIGAATVAGIAGNHFVPGAIADHLTSYGGMLTDSPQMSSLRWLEAGATGSYGTVVEPCNLLGKFPNVPVLIAHYLAGETLIEAYWKSVEMPGQGLFIGEPLAAPFRKR